MNTSTSRPLGRRIQAAVFKRLNVLMRVVLKMPFETPLSRRLMLVSFTGRRSGKRYEQPVSYVPVDGVLLTPGGGRWKENLRDGEPVRIRIRGRDAMARPELVADLDEVERLLAIMTVANPAVGRFVGIPKGPDGRLDRDRLGLAIRYGFRIVRWRVAPGSILTTP